MNPELSNRHRPLIGISISDPHKAPPTGYAPGDANALTLDLARTLIANGYATAFGHDWRPDGVMMALYEFAESHDAILPPPEQNQPIIYNFRHHGMKKGLENWEEKQIYGVLKLVDCKKPTDLNNDISDSIANSRALTSMRKEMTASILARVCLGGKDPANPEKMSSGRMPGVLEEILFSLAAKQPLYISGLFGGVTEWVVESMQRNEPPNLNFKLGRELGKYYQLNCHQINDRPFASVMDEAKALDFSSVQNSLHNYGLDVIARNNGLSHGENLRMFQAQTLDEFVNWLLIGLARVREEFR